MRFKESSNFHIIKGPGNMTKADVETSTIHLRYPAKITEEGGFIKHSPYRWHNFLLKEEVTEDFYGQVSQCLTSKL